MRCLLMITMVLVPLFWTASPASAVPPTAQPSPGYERRLEESRRYLHRFDRNTVPRRHYRRLYRR
jgi:hypothetical protein